MKLADKLIELRKQKGWSQEEFAEKLDVSRQAVSRWENETALPDAQNILRISKLFNVTTDYLLNEDSDDRGDMPIIETMESKTEEEAPSTRKKKFPFWWLILAICLVIVALCVIITIIIPKNEEHHHTAFSSVKENEVPSTCTAGGSYDEVVYCTDCNAEIMRTARGIEKLPHKLSKSVKENEVDSTCTAGGSYEEVVYCSTCKHAVVRTRRETEKLEHQYKDGKCTLCEKPKPSEGLLYMSNGDGTCFVDFGDCTDDNVVISDYSPSGDKVVQIKAYAFAGHPTIKSVYIPETITIIGEGAFQNCVELERVHLPSKITMINSYTFSGCEKLSELTIPSGVTYIGMEAFKNCRAFKSIVIPASVTKIGKFAFMNFSNCSGTITFEVYSAWFLYDDDDIEVHLIDFENNVSTPALLLTFKYTDYVWKRR